MSTKKPGQRGSVVGKRVRGSTYVHASARGLLSPKQQELLAKAEALAANFGWNVARIGAHDVSLLDYTQFDEDPFPELRASMRIVPQRRLVALRNFDSSTNPPILHRKELLLDHSDGRVEGWAALTTALVAVGAFAHSHRIGHRKEWANRLAELGLRVDGHQLCRK